MTRPDDIAEGRPELNDESWERVDDICRRVLGIEERCGIGPPSEARTILMLDDKLARLTLLLKAWRRSVQLRLQHARANKEEVALARAIDAYGFGGER
jgi:hypothetical protein